MPLLGQQIPDVVLGPRGGNDKSFRIFFPALKPPECGLTLYDLFQIVIEYRINPRVLAFMSSYRLLLKFHGVADIHVMLWVEVETCQRIHED